MTARCNKTTWLGPYVLGAVELDEWVRVDRHLQECDTCKAEVADLAGLPGLMRRLPMEDFVAEAHAPERKARRRLRRPLRIGLVAALAFLGLFFGARSVVWPGAPTRPHTVDLSGRSAATGVSGDVSLTAQSWGTELSVQVSGVPGGQQCWLVVTAADGRRVVGGSWLSDLGPGVWVPASAPFPPDEIASVEIEDTTRPLVTLTEHETAPAT